MTDPALTQPEQPRRYGTETVRGVSHPVVNEQFVAGGLYHQLVFTSKVCRSCCQCPSLPCWTSGNLCPADT